MKTEPDVYFSRVVWLPDAGLVAVVDVQWPGEDRQLRLHVGSKVDGAAFVLLDRTAAEGIARALLDAIGASAPDAEHEPW